MAATEVTRMALQSLKRNRRSLTKTDQELIHAVLYRCKGSDLYGCGSGCDLQLRERKTKQYKEKWV